jgi:hypothetical protein
VLDFARSAAQARRPDPNAADLAPVWQSWQFGLARVIDALAAP